MVGQPTTEVSKLVYAWLERVELFFWEIHGKGASHDLVKPGGWPVKLLGLVSIGTYL